MEFSTLYQELEYSTEMIRALLAGVEPKAARLKPNTQSWSILEVVCHLYDEEREDFREHLDFILHRQHAEWHAIDSERLVTERRYNEQNFVEMQENSLSNVKNHFPGSRDYKIRLGGELIQLPTAQLVRERCSPVGLHMTISTSANWWNSGAWGSKISLSPTASNTQVIGN